MIKIRMTRLGRKNQPYYAIVAADSRTARDGKCIEKLGQCNPKLEEPITSLNLEALKSWVSKGAQVSDTVRTLLKRQKISL